MYIKGKVFKYGDNVDTDVIIPARHLNTSKPEELALHCMEDIDPDFAKNVQNGDIIVGGENFGCGSSREHAPLSIKASGVSCVIASSFARIFYRNSINIGLPILECAQCSHDVKSGHIIRVDLDSGKIVNETLGKSYSTQPFPKEIQDIISRGGLLKGIGI